MLGAFPGEFNRFSWSPDGSRILVNVTESDVTGFRFAVANTDGSGYDDLDLGVAADYGSWRPDGRHIVFRGQLDDGTAGAFIANADGSNVRQLPIESVGLVDFEGLAWSPDGKHLSFMSDGSLGGITGWQINVADIDADGSLTELHRLDLDPVSLDERLPIWSPDSSRLAFLQEIGSRRQVGIFNADGSGYRLLGPEVSSLRILDYTWSPDGRSLVITELPEQESRREAERKMWSVDVATGAQTEIQTPVASWQRLAQ